MRSRHSRSRALSLCQVPFDLSEFLSGSGEIIRQLARPCPYTNTYIRPLRLRPLAGGGRGLFKLKSPGKI